MHSIYFWSSLALLIFRTLFVTLHAARLNDESKRSARVLRAIPTEHFGRDARRFLEEVCNTEVALTGMRFFRLNRSLILSVRERPAPVEIGGVLLFIRVFSVQMAGTVVTYELVLIQFQVLYVDVPKIDC